MGVGDVEVLSFWDILEPETGSAFQTRKSHFLHFLLSSDAQRTDGKERGAGRTLSPYRPFRTHLAQPQEMRDSDHLTI